MFVEYGCDWSSGAILLALKRKGIALGDIEKELGLKDGAIRNVFYRQCPRYEEVIAQKIGITPSMIWPSRYVDTNRLSA
ncbi:transcriptional regulator [Izhakiella australiensis]|uniref:Transcriptional regulator n=1 Tax=Izhakiella australiensis TaxID=1926881 RepID=A0A1S8YJP7_9GAMM|nr:transcriptional regulator [Izhakiella australiensis]